MPKLMLVLVVSLFAVGCSKRGDAVRFQLQPSPPEVCTNTLLKRARVMGYVETMADAANGFFSVSARTSLGGLPFTGATSRNIKRARAASEVKFNVQCQNGAVSVVAVGVDGPLDENDKMDTKLRKELDKFGVGLMSGDALAPVDYAASEGACVAEQLPEWQGATATQKKDLLARCRGSTPPPPAP